MLSNCGAEKTLESPLDSKEIQPVNPKGSQPWIFVGRTDAETEAPILWPPDAKNWLTGKDPDAGKDWRQEEKGTTEDKVVGWHHQLNGHEFAQTLVDSEGQERLVCCSPWGHKELDTTELLNWNGVWAALSSSPVFLPQMIWINKPIFLYCSFLVGTQSLFYLTLTLTLHGVSIPTVQIMKLKLKELSLSFFKLH